MLFISVRCPFNDEASTDSSEGLSICVYAKEWSEYLSIHFPHSSTFMLVKYKQLCKMHFQNVKVEDYCTSDNSIRANHYEGSS